MKFTMFKKETTDKKYHEDPFRAVNFPIGGDDIMRCPNGKAFHLQYRQHVKGNNYGRQEEVYTCEDCSGWARSGCLNAVGNRPASGAAIGKRKIEGRSPGALKCQG